MNLASLFRSPSLTLPCLSPYFVSELKLGREGRQLQNKEEREQGTPV